MVTVHIPYVLLPLKNHYKFNHGPGHAHLRIRSRPDPIKKAYKQLSFPNSTIALLCSSGRLVRSWAKRCLSKSYLTCCLFAHCTSDEVWNQMNVKLERRSIF